MTGQDFGDFAQDQKIGVWKVFSQKPLENEDLDRMFVERRDVQICDWLGNYRVDHKFGNVRFLLIVSQLMEVNMKGTYQSFKTAPTLLCCYEYYWLYIAIFAIFLCHFCAILPVLNFYKTKH